MIELKDILKGLREQKQVSMDKMCEDLNSLYGVALAKSTVSKWENGKAEPSLAYARILTKYFNVTLDYILGLEKEELYNFNNLSKAENILLANYNKLNNLGKEKLIDYSNDLIEAPKFTIKEENNVISLEEAKEYLKKFGRAAYGGDNNKDMSDEEIIELAMELKHQFEDKPNKYKK